jgi:hypothetical protein
MFSEGERKREDDVRKDRRDRIRFQSIISLEAGYSWVFTTQTWKIREEDVFEKNFKSKIT